MGFIERCKGALLDAKSFSSGGSSFGRSLVIAHGNARINGNHFSEDIEHGLNMSVMVSDIVCCLLGSYLRHRLIIDADQLSRVRIDLQGAVETQCCVDRVGSCKSISSTRYNS